MEEKPMGDPTSAVDVRHEDGVTHLTLNRPEKLNAFDARIVEGLIDGFDDAEAHRSHLVVFSGAGRAFSAGFDLSGLEAQTDGDLLHRFVRVEILLQRIYMAPMTTLALAHGRCFGAAADVFAACQRRVADEETKFRMPGLRFGIVLGTRRLSRLVGPDAALDILETTRIFDVKDGLSMGFVQQTCAKENWPAIIAKSSDAARMLGYSAKRSMHENVRGDEEALNKDLAVLVRSAAVPGLKERIQEFVAANKKS